MNEPFVLKSSQATDICYDICFEDYNAHDNFPWFYKMQL